jgi:hypothetical protein
MQYHSVKENEVLFPKVTHECVNIYIYKILIPVHVSRM